MAKAGRRQTKRDEAHPAAEPAALLEAIFAALPEGSGAGHDLPELVRQRRRERAKQRLLDALEARGDAPITAPIKREVWMLAERWARKGFDAAFPDADRFEIVCVEEGEARRAEASGDEKTRWEAAERAHRRAIVQAYGSIEIRGLQLSERVHQELETAYVPLSVEGPPEPPALSPPKKQVVAKALRRKKTATVKRKGDRADDAAAIAALLRQLDRPRLPILQALAQHAKMLLVGAPGSGKSTVIAYLATRAAKGELGPELGSSKELVPFVLPVRSVRESLATVEALARAVGDGTGLLGRALHEGRALLLVDGLDEAQQGTVEGLIADLERHTARHPANRLLATSRPSGLPEEGAGSLGGLTRVRLMPMTAKEVGTFIDRWCLAAELSLKKANDEAEAAAAVAADDLKARVRRSGAIEKLAQTPLLCTVVCVAHRFLGHGIPERRTALYDVITNVLLYEWDRAKFPEGSAIGKLDAHAKRALLGHLARSMHEARLAELPEEAVVQRFAEQLPALGHKAAEAKPLIAEIRDRNGILVERSPGVFAFSHLTFQEYLAAVKLIGDQAYDLLLSHHKDPWWHEVIALAAGLPGADAARMVDRLLAADRGEVGAGTMLAMQCAETAIVLPEAQRRVIGDRIALLVPPRDREDMRRLARLGDVAGPVLLREFERTDIDWKAPILIVLGVIGYAPAAGAVSKHISDPSRTSESLSAKMVEWGLPHGDLPFSMFAMRAAVDIAVRWEHTLPLFLSTIPNATREAGIMLRSLQDDEDDTGRIARLLYRHYKSTHVKQSAAFSAPSAPPRKRAARSG